MLPVETQPPAHVIEVAQQSVVQAHPKKAPVRGAELFGQQPDGLVSQQTASKSPDMNTVEGAVMLVAPIDSRGVLLLVSGQHLLAEIHPDAFNFARYLPTAVRVNR